MSEQGGLLAGISLWADEQPRILILGGSGLLGRALAKSLGHRGISCFTPSHAELNVLDYESLSAYVSGLEPDFIFNCVAYTQVDKAESEPDAAMLLNRDLPKMLGSIIKNTKSFLVHYSTDFVFDGLKGEPYTTEDQTCPVSVYGASKLAGEEELGRLDLENAAIVRTAWLFGPERKNFVHTILSRCKQNGEARVVVDQFGSPTYTYDLAVYSLALARFRQGGIFHLVNDGEASWFDLAVEAVKNALGHSQVYPITTDSLSLPANRPAFSVLDTQKFTDLTGIKPRHWHSALQEYLLHDEIKELKEQGNAKPRA